MKAEKNIFLNPPEDNSKVYLRVGDTSGRKWRILQRTALCFGLIISLGLTFSSVVNGAHPTATHYTLNHPVSVTLDSARMNLIRRIERVVGIDDGSIVYRAGTARVVTDSNIGHTTVEDIDEVNGETFPRVIYARNGEGYVDRASVIELTDTYGNLHTVNIIRYVVQNPPPATINKISSTMDRMPPTFSVSGIVADGVYRTGVRVTLAFNEPVTDFDATDISVTRPGAGGNPITVENFTATSTSEYTFTLEADLDYTVSSRREGLMTIAAGAAIDTAGNPSSSSVAINFFFINPRPGVTVTRESTVDPVSSDQAITITFGQAVTGFDMGDITITGATISGFTGTDAVYEFTAQTPANMARRVSIEIAENMANSGGHQNIASAPLIFTIDKTPRIEAIDDIDMSEGDTRRLVISVSNFDAFPTYQLERLGAITVLPTWISITDIGVMTLTPPHTVTIFQDSFNFRVTAATSQNSQTEDFRVTVTNVESPLTFSTRPPLGQNYIVGAQIPDLSLSEVTGGTGVITYTLLPLPDGLTFTDTDRTLRGTPNTAGTTELTYTATDANGVKAVLKFRAIITATTFNMDKVADQNYTLGTPISALILPEAMGGTGIITYTLSSLPGGLTFTDTDRTLRGTPNTARTTELTYTATDANGVQTTLKFTVTVVAPSTFNMDSVADQNYIVGAPISALILPEAMGGTGIITYTLSSLPGGLTFTDTDRTLRGTPETAGTTELTYTATDAHGVKAVLNFRAIITATTFNMDSVADQNYIVGAPISALILPEAMGGTGIITYTLSSLPGGLTFTDTDRTLRGTPNTAGTTELTYTATDTNGIKAVLKFFVVVGSAPVFQGMMDDQRFTVGVAIGEAPDDQSTPRLSLPEVGSTVGITYRLSPIPDGLDFDAVQGALHGTPETAGLTKMTYTVTDASGVEAVLRFAIIVAARPTFNVGTPAIERRFTAGAAISVIMLPDVTGGTSPISYSIAGLLPDGLLFDRGSRTLTGTPEIPGRSMVIYVATDANGGSATLTTTSIVIAAPPDFVDEDGTMLTLSDRTYPWEEAIEPLVLPESTAGTSPIAYTLSSLPDGLTFTGRTLRGVPTRAGVTTEVTYTATDANGVDVTATFMITITDEAPVFNAQVADQAYTVGTTVNESLTGAMGGNGALTYVLSSLPEGLTFNAADRSITGTPIMTGITEITYTVQDADSNTSANDADTQRFQITVSSMLVVTLILSPDSISENNGMSIVTASLDHPSSEAIVIGVSAEPVAPAGAGDFVLTLNRELTIAAGATVSRGVVTVTSIQNVVDAADKQVSVSAMVSSGNGMGLERPDDVILTIIDDDATPKMTLVLSLTTISENNGASIVTAMLDHPSSKDTIIRVSAEPVAPAGANDFSLSWKDLLIVAGATTSIKTVTIIGIDNQMQDGDKTVTVSATASNSQGVTNPSNQILTITDDDELPTAITLSVMPTEINEGSGSQDVVITATLGDMRSSSTVLGTDTLVTLSSFTGTANDPGDYSIDSLPTITIAAGAMSGTASLSLTLQDDSIDEPDETILIDGTASGGLSLAAADVTDAILTITDNDDPPTGITLSVNPSTVNEGDGSQTVMVTATFAGTTVATDTLVTLSSFTGTANDPGDYSIDGLPAITIPAGGMSGTASFSLTLQDDSIDEPDETILIDGTAIGGVTFAAAAVTEAILTITDNDDRPTVSLVLVDRVTKEPLDSISENNGRAAVTAMLDHPSSEDTTVTVTLTAVAPAVQGVDFRLNNNPTPLIITAGQVFSIGNVKVIGIDNNLVDGDRSVTVSGMVSDNQRVNGPSDQTLTIIDDDSAPTSITLGAAPASISENGVAQAVEITATLGGGTALGTATTVTLSIAGTATSPADYGDLGMPTITIAAGMTSGTTTLSITPVADNLVEGDETLIIDGAATGGVTLGADAVTATSVTITDGDSAPTSITLSAAPASISENGVAQAVEITATLEGAAVGADTTVTLSIAGTATSPADYGDLGMPTITIAAGMTSGTTTLSITPVADNLVEGDETLIIDGAATGGVTLGADAVTATSVTITDGDSAPTSITLSAAPASISENDVAQAVEITATLEGAALGTATTVTLSIAGTATSPADYGDLGMPTITIAAGMTSGTTTLSITPVADNLVEGDETLIIDGAATGGVTLGADAVTATSVTITDGDSAPTSITLSAAPASISENDVAQAVEITATLGGGTALGTATTVTLSIAGTATSPADYGDLGMPTITIAAGMTSGTTTLSITPVADNLVEGDETLIIDGAATGGVTLGADAVTATSVTITDGDSAPTSITLSAAPASISENDVAQAVEITATLGGGTALGTATTVTLSIAGTATSPADYGDLGMPTITIAAGMTSGTTTLSITPVADNLVEGDETLIIDGAATGGVTLGADAVTATSVTITDGDSAPTSITLSAAPASISENDVAQAVEITATLGGGTALGTATTVTLSIAGTATSPADYGDLGMPTITIAAGMTSGTTTLSITPVADNLVEGDETLIIDGAATGGVTLGADAVTATSVTITDGDSAPTSITLSAAPASISENDVAQAVEITATLGGGTALGTATTVTLSIAGTATSPADYGDLGMPTITIAAGMTSGTTTLSITPVADNLVEGDETLIIDGAATGGVTLGADAVTATSVTITDGDSAPTSITLSAAPASISENDVAQAVEITATLGGGTALGTATTVTLSIAGTATSPADYGDLGMPTITIAAGMTSGTTTLSITPVADNLVEGDETLIIDGAATGGVTLGADAVTATSVTITDGDSAPTSITLGAAPASISENDVAQAVEITATLGGGTALGTATTVTLSIAGTATSPADYGDLGMPTITIAAGMTSGTTTLSITPVADNLVEGDETLIIDGAATGGVTLGADAVTATSVTITDGDSAPTSITLGAAPASISENDVAQAVEITATLGGGTALGTATTVTLSIAGTATSPADYGDLGMPTITIAAGMTSGTTTLSITPVADNLVEGDETLIIDGAATGGVTLGADAVTATSVTITDGDSAPTSITLSAAPASISENDVAQAVEITATLGGGTALGTATTVTLSIAGTATSPADYGDLGMPTITIAAGMTSGTTTLSITPVADNLVEGDETLIIDGAATGGVTLGADAVTATSVTITDGDSAPTSITLSAAPASISENDVAQAVEITATLGGGTALGTATTVTLSIAGTATSPADYGDLGMPTITIAAGMTSGTTTLSITPVADNLVEGDETLIIDGAATGGVTLGADAVTATSVTITDGDSAPTSITLSAAPASISENDVAQAVEITATLGGGTALGTATTVTLSIAGTATSPADYGDLGMPTITIAAGMTSGTTTLSITPVADNLVEGDETLIIDGAATGGVTLGADAVTATSVTITDGDSAPTSITLSAAPASISENDVAQAVEITATLGGGTALGTATTVTLSIAGTATSPADYGDLGMPTITIAAGMTSGTTTLSITPVADNLVEGDETLIIDGAATGGVTLGADAVTATSVTITDGDSAPTSITLSAAPASISENDVAQAVEITATLGGGTALGTATTVTLSIAGTATSPADYGDLGMPTITIAAGMTSGTTTLSITPVADNLVEGDETLIIDGAATGGVTLGADAVTATSVTITDDDTAPTFAAGIGDQLYTEGAPIVALTLLEATGGNGALSYDLTSDLPPGLTFSASDRTIRGTPTEVSSSARYTWTVVDADNNTAPSDSASLSFNITVESATDLTAERVKQLNKAIMPRLTQAMLAITTTAISNRIDSTFSETPHRASYQIDGLRLDSQSTLSSTLRGALQKLPAYVRSLESGNINWRQMLANSSFALSLQDNDSGSGTGLSLWGIGDYSKLGRKDSDLTWGGELFSIRLGADKRIRDNLLLGVLVSWSDGDIDLDFNDIEDEGSYQHQVTSIHPYLAWNNHNTQLWGNLGYGQGELEIQLGRDKLTTATRLLSLGGGVKDRLSQMLSIKSDISLARTSIDKSDYSKQQHSNSQRLRLLLEVNLFACGLCTSRMEIGLRYDGGDEDKGLGAVMDAVAGYTNSATGLSMEGRLHTLIGRDDYTEWGISGFISLTAGAHGRGLSFSLSPSYDTRGSGTGALWQQNQSDIAGGRVQSYRTRLDARLSYGFAHSGGNLLLPYSEITYGASNSYRIGVQWQRGTRLDVKLFFDRHERAGDRAEHAVLLEARLWF